MDYENEHDSDVPRLWARDTEDLGAFDTYLFLLFIQVLSLNQNKPTCCNTYSANLENNCL